MKKRFREYIKRTDGISTIVNSIDPEQVVLDAHLSYYCLYFPNKISKTIIFNTKLLTRPAFDTPPLNCGFYSNSQIFIKSFSSLLWRYQVFKVKLDHYITKAVFRMKDDHSFIERSLKKNHIKFSSWFLPRPFGIFHYELDPNKAPVRKFVIKSDRIEYPWKKLSPKESYLNLDPFICIHPPSAHPDLYKFLQSFFELKQKNGSVKLIFCSLGSMTSSHTGKCFKFLQETVKAFNGKTQYHIVISSGGISPSAFAYDENVFISEKLPQHNILQFADLMITHGGLNSILECLHFQVPMLVYPVNPHFDQKGNGARVKFSGYGLTGKMTTADSRSIFNLALQLLIRERPCEKEQERKIILS